MMLNEKVIPFIRDCKAFAFDHGFPCVHHSVRLTVVKVSGDYATVELTGRVFDDMQKAFTCT